MAHVACAAQTRDDVHQVLVRLERAGIENIIALRGDPPRGEKTFVPASGGFAHATDLIEHVKRNFDFGIAAACYPEGHVESPDLESDIEYAKMKVDLGADFLITQLYYDNRYFFDFLDRARQVGIDVPILPGLLPIVSASQIMRIAGVVWGNDTRRSEVQAGEARGGRPSHSRGGHRAHDEPGEGAMGTLA